jgi:hypothetical protein
MNTKSYKMSNIYETILQQAAASTLKVAVPGSKSITNRALLLSCRNLGGLPPRLFTHQTS